MGNGGFLPDALQAKKVIVPALNSMFQGQGLHDTRNSFKALRHFYKKLGEHSSQDQGASLRQRTLRHLAWLLTAEVFDRPTDYPYPHERFRLWLRYLTWVEHGPYVKGYEVYVDRALSTEKPAEAILKTLFDSLDRANGKEIVFDWEPATGTKDLVVDIKRNTDPMTIVLRSIRQEDIPASVTSDHDDWLRKT